MSDEVEYTGGALIYNSMVNEIFTGKQPKTDEDRHNLRNTQMIGRNLITVDVDGTFQCILCFTHLHWGDNDGGREVYDHLQDYHRIVFTKDHITGQWLYLK